MNKNNKQKEKYSGIVKFMSITIVMAMLAYTAVLCLQKENKYSSEPKKDIQTEETKKYLKTK